MHEADEPNAVVDLPDAKITLPSILAAHAS
jgi:hypothetical protein